MNEFELIDSIKRRTRLNAGVVVGIGDDTAVINRDQKFYTLITADMLIENKHFRLKEASAYEIGHKAMAVNLSDIAAMGGIPEHAVVAVGLPKKCAGSFALELYRGLESVARSFGAAVVGGDTNASSKLIVSVTLTGRVERSKLALRSGARPGDQLFVTGPLGGSYASKKHLNFTPRLKEAQILVNKIKIHAMMDVSDGLASDLFRLCAASHVGAVLWSESVPKNKGVSLKEALSDGEDFELLFAAPPSQAARLKNLPFKVCAVGAVVSSKNGIKLQAKNGQQKNLQESGFRHF